MKKDPSSDRNLTARSTATPTVASAGAKALAVDGPAGHETPPRRQSGLLHVYSQVRHTPPKRRVTRVHHLQRMKSQGRKINAVTCYDATFARLVDSAHMDVVLVGDSLGNVIQGQDSTIPVTLDHMIYHARAVARGLQYAHLVVDMPFMSYHGPEVALPNAARLMAEGGAHAVKLEGGRECAEVINRLVQCGIPVMGHVGLTPQSVHAMGGHRVQGKHDKEQERIIADAEAVEAAGAYAIVLEGIPHNLAATISQRLAIPTIGIGAGPDCDGQILVLYDMLGLNPDFQPKFVKHFAPLGQMAKDALEQYAAQVQSGAFPTLAESYTAPQSTNKKAWQAAVT